MNLKELDQPIERQKNYLSTLLKDLKGVETTYERIEILNGVAEVTAFFSFPSTIKTFLSGLTPECEYVIKAIFAIGQGSHIFEGAESGEVPALRALLEDLLDLESFYADIGGIVGYHHLVLTLLTLEKDGEVNLTPPQGIDLTEEREEIKEAIIEGIKQQGKMAELYPVGGAADRLELKNEKTDEALPAARLIFLGKPLLEGVINDLQAREYLHYKLFGRQVTTPIAMMTSKVHKNHDHIQEICRKKRWFGRPKESFHFITQPSVPTFTKKGNWCLSAPLKLLLKPGGHGMLWKLMHEGNVFEALKNQGAEKALIRQINNPMAAIDYGLLAFLGIGHQKDKAFGFASCPRLVNAHEGMNVIREIGGEKALTNIEYCDFEKCGIEDKPIKPGNKYSRFPSNTNILFADLEEVEKVSKKIPYPGLLVNFRKGNHHHSPDQKEEIARLETTMQNIADGLTAPSQKELPSYLTYYERRKTISTTKRKSTGMGTMLETPEGCYYDYMLNVKELLENHCQIKLPPFPDEKTFTREGPSFLFSMHPALGPLFSIIGQKLRGGTLSEGSELQLEIAEIVAKNLHLNGSLLIHATQIMGHHENDLLRLSDQTGKCILENVHIENEGIDWEEDHLFWKHEVKRKSVLKIILHGNSTFIARDVRLQGNLILEVPHGMQMTAQKEKGQVTFVTCPLKTQGPLWSYQVAQDHTVALTTRCSR